MLRFIAVLVISLSVLGCEGPMGPAGDAGDSGTHGDTGQQGESGPVTREVFTGRLDSAAKATRDLPSRIGTTNDPPSISVYVSIGGKTYFAVSLDSDTGGESSAWGFAGTLRIRVVIFANSVFANGYYMIVVVY